ncbi:MAG: SurA N-terminal domain-containing protein [Betaproteobacteria bacterium]
MFDLVTKHKHIAQGILFLLMVPFAFFGVDYYFRGNTTDAAVATVAGNKITQAEFIDSMREQQDQMRRQLGRNFDPAMFESPEVRFALLEQLINQRLVTDKALSEHFRVPDVQLHQFISTLPAFQDSGTFSPDRYRQMLATQNMSPLMFEQRLREDLLRSAIQEPIVSANIVARSSVERYLGLLEQQREVAVALVDPAPFLRDIKIGDADIRAFYDKNAGSFQTPEQARIEYVLLTQEALASRVVVEPAEVRKQFDANAKQYTADEERSASHILIPVKPDASAEDKAAAKKLADEVYSKAKAAPAKFADLAREFSKDPGSAAQGGDLGQFARGSMVKPFEDAVFAGKNGDLLAPVQSDFGWHIIKVTGIRPSRTLGFDDVKVQIESELRKQRAAQKFATSAEQFQNLVYEQADNLNGVAKALELTIETSPLITRSQAQAIGLGNPKFVQALFSPESLQGKRNIEAIEVAPGTLIAARILEYKPAAPRPFDEVKDEIRLQLVRRAATDLAQAAGQEKLKLLQAGKSDKDAGVTFAKPVVISRGQAQPGLSPEALGRVFETDADKLPAFTGAINEKGGFSIVKVLNVFTPSPTDKARLDQATSRLSEQLGRELFQSYLQSLRAKADVKINQVNLDKK